MIRLSTDQLSAQTHTTRQRSAIIGETDFLENHATSPL